MTKVKKTKKTTSELPKMDTKEDKKLFPRPKASNPYLKKRKDIRDSCHSKRNEKQRVIYGTCRCDSFSMSTTLLRVIANYLYQFMADAKDTQVREDWELMEKHADAIMAFAEADAWDLIAEGEEKEKRYLYLEKEKKFREAMFWLTENIQSLWW